MGRNDSKTFPHKLFCFLSDKPASKKYYPIKANMKPTDYSLSFFLIKFRLKS